MSHSCICHIGSLGAEAKEIKDVGLHIHVGYHICDMEAHALTINSTNHIFE